MSERDDALAALLRPSPPLNNPLEWGVVIVIHADTFPHLKLAVVRASEQISGSKTPEDMRTSACAGGTFDDYYSYYSRTISPVAARISFLRQEADDLERKMIEETE